MPASSSRAARDASTVIQHAGAELERVGNPQLPETFQEALIECIRAAGGSKVVAHELWPAKASANIEAARQYLAACLNPERAEKLSLDEVLYVLRRGRECGCHAGMQFLSGALGYAPPVPTEPEDARAQLQRQFITATRELARMARRIEAMGSGVRREC